MSKKKAKEKEIGPETPENPDVVIVKTGSASKLSPRSEGGIIYQIGRVGEEILLRIAENIGGGRHSREWVPLSTIRATMTPPIWDGKPFKSTALIEAFKGRSQNNSGFLVATLRAEGLLSEDKEHKGMSCLAGDFDGWEKAICAAKPVLKEDGHPETAKRHPEPKDTKFKRKDADPETVEETSDEMETVEAAESAAP